MNTQASETPSLEGEYARVSIGGEVYGLPTGSIGSIVELPTIRRVPRAPDFIPGVANIGGRIVPLLDPLVRFGHKGQEIRDRGSERVVLVQVYGSMYGLMVDEVLSITHLPGDTIEPVNPVMIDREARFIKGMARADHELIHLLDMETFVHAGHTGRDEEQKAYDRFSAGLGTSVAQAPPARLTTFLAVRIGEEEYGIRADSLRELILASTMQTAADAPDYVAGLVPTRNGLVPVVDMQKKFGLDPVPYTAQSRVVVIGTSGCRFGLLANQVNGFLHLGDNDIKEPPGAVTEKDSRHLAGVALVDAGRRLVVLLNQDRILGDTDIARLADMEDAEITPTRPAPRTNMETQSLGFAVFRIREMEMAFPLNGLAEIIPYTNPTPVPKAPEAIVGLVPLKGDLVPVLDLHARLDIPGAEPGADTRIVVFREKGSLFGIMVDELVEILRVSKSEVLDPPEIIQGMDTRFVRGIIRVPDSDRTPVVLDAGALVAEAEPIEPDKAGTS